MRQNFGRGSFYIKVIKHNKIIFVIYSKSHKVNNKKLRSNCRNAGQTCVSTNRVLVQESVHDEFVEKLKNFVEKTIVIGDGFESGVNQGPLINKSQFE